MRRVKQSQVTNSWARCTECRWSMVSAGALGSAAQHHDKTGHVVDAQQTIRVRYGDRKLLRHNRG